jgi:FemAB-related protein (PEP-CTERM system-associated)
MQPLLDVRGTWRRVVAECEGSGLAHSPEWFALIRRAYGHSPLYLTIDDGNGRSGVLPAFVVRRPFFAPIVTSMPFLDSGGPCSRSAATRRMLVDHLIVEARRLGASRVEVRCAEPLDLSCRPSEHKVNMTLPLPADSGDLWRGFDKQVRNQVRKAERSGLQVERGGAEKLPAFYEAFVERMRDLGSPPHAPKFLAAVFEEFGAQASILLVRKGTTTVGGLVSLSFKDRVVVPWATCRTAYFDLCPNMLLYWEALRDACAGGFGRFDFGRSTRDSGTYRFKRQWGAREERLFWYSIPVASPRGPAAPATPQPERGRAQLLIKAWQRLPVLITRHLGPRIRRYLTQ